MAQINYTTVGGDSLPSVAEASGHPGEWPLILESAPWLAELDYLAVPPGSTVLLPPGWVPRGYEDVAAAEDTGQEPADLGSRSAAQLIELANNAQTLDELDAIDAAANGRVTVEEAVARQRQALLAAGVAT